MYAISRLFWLHRNLPQPLTNLNISNENQNKNVGRPEIFIYLNVFNEENFTLQQKYCVSSQ